MISALNMPVIPGCEIRFGTPVCILGSATSIGSNVEIAAAQANCAERARVLGFAVGPSEYNQAASVATGGIIDGAREEWAQVTDDKDGLKIGATYFLHPRREGRLTRRQPVLEGEWIAPVGVAVAPTRLRIEIREPRVIPAWSPFELVTFDPSQMEESPWMRASDWSGRFVGLDETGRSIIWSRNGNLVALAAENATDDLLVRDVRPATTDPSFYGMPQPWDLADRVLAWDGAPNTERDYSTGIARLKDGRFVSWESDIDYSGTGFHPDGGSGGGADISIARTALAAIRAISEQGRERLRFATLPSEAALVSVLHDRYLEIGITSTKGWVIRDGIPGPLVEVLVARRQTLVAVAQESGEFGELVEWRVGELLDRWDAHYDQITQAEIDNNNEDKEAG